jgi:hypothetical protein
MKDTGRLPQFLQYVHQVQDRSRIEFPVDSDLERTFAVRQSQTS